MEFLHRNIYEVGLCLRNGLVTVLDLKEAVLAILQKIKPLNAFISHIDFSEKAEASHNRIMNKRPLSILDGIPVAVKDNFCISGTKTTCGSQMLSNYIPPYTATVVERLENAGALIIGKTNMDEFAMGCGTVDSAFDVTTNLYRSCIPYSVLPDNNSLFFNDESIPTDELEGDWYICGGSSGGSAISVASCAAFSAIGSDTGGSVRNPASYCGVIGMKPSYGVVSRYGLISLVNSLDVPGIFGRTVDDVFVTFNIIAAVDRKDSTSIEINCVDNFMQKYLDLKNLVIGIPVEYHCDGLSSEIVDIWTKMADILENSGSQVRCISMPHTQYATLCYSVLNPCEVASNFTRYTGLEYGLRVSSPHSMEATYALSRSAGLSSVVRGRILAGNYFLLRENVERYFRQALKVRRLIWQDFQDAWQSGVDLLLTPCTLSSAIRYSAFSKLDSRAQVAIQDVCTQAVNMAGVCAISLPVCFNDQGVPLALQLIAPHGHDYKLLHYAKLLEGVCQFPKTVLCDIQ